MDEVNKRAVIALAVSPTPSGGPGGFQFLDLGFSPAFEQAGPFASQAIPANTGQVSPGPAANISEDIAIDPVLNLILSPGESNNFELVNVTTTTPAFFENTVPVLTSTGISDSAGEDCDTHIALAPFESGSATTMVSIADLSQATYSPGAPGAPGMWTAPSLVQTLSGSDLTVPTPAGPIAVARGTHIGVLAEEGGGFTITAFALPPTHTNLPAILDWVTGNISTSFSSGSGCDPHTVTAYMSPSPPNHAIALIANGGTTPGGPCVKPSMLAVVDLTKMLTLARTGGHICAANPLPSAVVRFISVPPQ